MEVFLNAARTLLPSFEAVQTKTVVCKLKISRSLGMTSYGLVNGNANDAIWHHVVGKELTKNLK